MVQCKQKHGCDSARQYTSPRISQVHGFHRSTNFTVPPVHESTTFTSPRVFKFVRVIELLSYLRRLYVLPEILELPHVCSFLRSDVERRILPVETWLGYAHPGLRRRTSRAWWNSESCTLGDRYVLRCRASAGFLQSDCFYFAEVYVIASGVFRGDEISARGDADAFAFSDSKDKALRLQAPSCRSGIP